MCYATFMFQFHKLIFKVEYVVEENMKFFFASDGLGNEKKIFFFLIANTKHDNNMHHTM